MTDNEKVDFDSLYDGIGASTAAAGGDPCLVLSNGWYLRPVQSISTGALTGELDISAGRDPADRMRSYITVRTSSRDIGLSTAIAEDDVIALKNLNNIDKEALFELSRRIDQIVRS